jgi:hypothetical protein
MPSDFDMDIYPPKWKIGIFMDRWRSRLQDILPCQAERNLKKVVC